MQINLCSELAKLKPTSRAGRKALIPSLNDSPTTFDIRKHPMKIVESNECVEHEKKGVGKICGYVNKKWIVVFKVDGEMIEELFSAGQIVALINDFRNSYGKW